MQQAACLISQHTTQPSVLQEEADAGISTCILLPLALTCSKACMLRGFPSSVSNVLPSARACTAWHACWVVQTCAPSIFVPNKVPTDASHLTHPSAVSPVLCMTA